MRESGGNHFPRQISSRENPAVRNYIRLRDKRSERRRQSRFVLEGVRLVHDALQGGAQIETVLLTQSAYTRNEAMWADTPVTLISDALAHELAQTVHEQGVFAVGVMPRNPSAAELLSRGSRYAVLCNLQDPGNLGMILRTADALGVDGVLLCGCCDVYSPKVVRAAMGSLYRVPLCIHPDIDEILALCREKQIESCAAVVTRTAEQVGTIRFGRSAVLIGNEGNGLPPQVSAACDRRITIPMQGAIESLNAAMAAGIILWEMMK